MEAAGEEIEEGKRIMFAPEPVILIRPEPDNHQEGCDCCACDEADLHRLRNCSACDERNVTSLVDQIAQALIEAVNAQRASDGLPPILKGEQNAAR